MASAEPDTSGGEQRWVARAECLRRYEHVPGTVRLWDSRVSGSDAGDVRQNAGCMSDVGDLYRQRLAERRAAWSAPAPKYQRGWLARYTRLVTNASNGAVLS